MGTIKDEVRERIEDEREAERRAITKRHTMKQDDMVGRIWCAMDNRRDMDTGLTDYAKAAMEAVGWQDILREQPDLDEVVVCTDGKARWLDKRIVGFDVLKWQGHVATHWHPLLDLPAAPPPPTR